jgi:hypothetical protein
MRDLTEHDLRAYLADLRASPDHPQEGDDVADLLVGLTGRLIRLEDHVARMTVTLAESLARIERKLP